ncbi:PREDICTED: uncharacterized protein LOC105461562 [Wasmannia auropunctata]|uniref:uncharacterized protein LOC105461562 n=1 Tax=Wasmannia auropunctata TaxID=64793 RepID=UPI0005EF7965|nr:PREDICTED: uncharacterized protein LOC105461562 [Wasmannia auropunctata]
MASEGNSSASDKVFFVIYEKEEKSFSTVHHTDVIYDDHVKINDAVTFFWCKKKHEGIIRFMSDTYEDCVKESLRLNSEEKKKEQKKEDFFHASEPRKAKIKCREGCRKITNKRKISNSIRELPKSKKKESARAKANNTVDRELLNLTKKKSLMPTALSKKKEKDMSHMFHDENDHLTESEEGNIVELSSSSDTKTLVSSDTENGSNKENNDSVSTDESSCSSSDEHTKEENTISESKKLRSLAAQLATKFDIQTLEKLVSLGPKAALMQHNSRPENELIASMGSDDSKIARSEPQSKHSESTEMSKTENEVEMHDIQSPESEPVDKSQLGLINSNSNIMQTLKAGCVNNTVPKIKISGLNNMFSEDMFLVKDPALGTALNEVKSIYCLQEKYIQAENATSATMAGRRLLDGVFTPEALSVCSLSGMPPRGKGKLAYADKSLIKPYLCPKAVTAIIDKALKFQKIKHWHPKKDSSQIRQAMAVRINEVASKYAKEDP